MRFSERDIAMRAMISLDRLVDEGVDTRSAIDDINRMFFQCGTSFRINLYCNAKHGVVQVC